MKTQRRIMAMVLAFVMTFCALPSGFVMAAEGSEQIGTEITVEKVGAAPGDTVSVHVSIQKNPGIIGATLQLNYGPELELIGAENGAAFSKLSMTEPGRYVSPCRFVWSTVSINETDIKNGIILELSFKVSENAEAGTQIPVELSYEDGDILDNSLDEVNVTISNGYVSIEDYVPGDLDGNKKVNTRDVVLLSRYLAGGYDTVIDARAADVNADAKINTRDVILISRFIAGGYDVELVGSNGNASAQTHNLQGIEFQAATCTEDGHIAYWECVDCHKYFSDSEGRHELSSESTVIPATGHKPVVDPAVEPTSTTPGLTEGSHCEVCGEVLVAQQPWNDKFYEIRYNIANGDPYLAGLTIENPNPATIKEGGSYWLIPLEVEGYTFIGWFDGAGSNAEQIKRIENADHSMTLYAHWDILTYSIQYKSDLVPVASDTYTAKAGKVLPVPELNGYRFVTWTDFYGKEYSQIPKGTTGDITLYANWLSKRNEAWSKKKLEDPYIYEDDDVILFAYEIGEVRNVPIYTVEDFGMINSDGISQTVTKKYSVTTEKTLMNSFAQTLQKATTDSATWTLSNDWSDSISISEEYCEQNGITVEEAIARSKSDTGNWYVSNSQGGAYSSTVVDSTDTYNLKTFNNNTHSWSKDYEEKVTHGTDVLTYNTTNHTSGYQETTKREDSFGLDIGYSSGNTPGPNLNGSFEETNETGRSDDNHSTHNTGKETTTRGDDTTTMKGMIYDFTSGSQTGTVSNHTDTTVNSRNWNYESGYGGSSTVSQNESIAKALSTMISSKKGYGSSYILGGGESSTQGLVSSNSKSDQYSSAVTYSELSSEEKEVSYTTTNTRTGFHRWVIAGTAHVFGVVGYDIAKNSYFVYSYSIMDDSYQRFEDYSYQTGAYNDNEAGVIPFEIPAEINNLVNQRVFETDGLEVDLNGTITRYTGTDTFVVIPDYKVINHNDGTSSVVRVTGLSKNVFRGNKSITGVKLSRYIDEIPESAFEGCSNLWDFESSASRIGANAFKDCPLLNEWYLSNGITALGDQAFAGAEVLSVKARDTDVMSGALNSGAKRITIGLSEMDGTSEKTTLSDRELNIPAGTTAICLNGYGKEFSNLAIHSEAEKTVLNRLSINTGNGIPMWSSSSQVLLNQCNISGNGIGLVLTAEDLELDLYGVSRIETAGNNALLCRDTALVRAYEGLKTELNLNGNLVTCGNISDPEEFLNIDPGNIVIVSREEFDKMLHSFTLTFDANGGSCETISMVVDNATQIGTLPEAVREGYDFDGWYLEDGSKLQEDTVFTTGEDQTATAHWKVKQFTATWVNGGGADIVVTRNDSPLRGAEPGILSSGDPIYYDDVLSVTYAAQSGYMLGETGQTEFTVRGDLTSDDIYAMVGKLSDGWVEEADLPQGATVLEEKWTYTFTSRVASSNPSLDGYTLCDTEWEWSDYGAWSSWSNTSVSGTDYRQVETRTVPATYKTQYNYSRWRSGLVNGIYHFGPWQGSWSGVYCGTYEERGWTDSALSVHSSQTYDGTLFYLYGDGTWFNQTTRQAVVTAAYTQYRYRDRSKVYTYIFEKDIEMESETEPAPSGKISNVKRWVKYMGPFVKPV